MRIPTSQTGLPPTTVHRCIPLFGLQPHRTKRFKSSSDPFHFDKVRDIVGLSVNPPDNALEWVFAASAHLRAWGRSKITWVFPNLNPSRVLTLTPNTPLANTRTNP